MMRFNFNSSPASNNSSESNPKGPGLPGLDGKDTFATGAAIEATKIHKTSEKLERVLEDAGRNQNTTPEAVNEEAKRLHDEIYNTLEKGGEVGRDSAAA